MDRKRDSNIPSKGLKEVKLFLFDFDGVFTSGQRGEAFNGRDALGVNMLRFGYYLISKRIPAIGITTGENNSVAIDFAEREHLDYLFLGVKDKKSILDFFDEPIRPEETAVVFDDVNDLSLAERAGFRFLINQPGSLAFQDLMRKQKQYDYLTKSFGGQGAVREICELILDSLGIYSQCVEQRWKFTETYQNYWRLRNNLSPTYFAQKGNKLRRIK